jgi:hypothetical protein
VVKILDILLQYAVEVPLIQDKEMVQ